MILLKILCTDHHEEIEEFNKVLVYNVSKHQLRELQWMAFKWK